MNIKWGKFSILRSLFFALLAFYSFFCYSKTAPQYFVKATFFVQFRDFTTWPENKKHHELPLLLCVLGRNPFGNFLQNVVSHTTKKNSVQLLFTHDYKKVDPCNILFISRSETNNLSKIFKFLKKKSILTVSDIPDFAYKKGMIELVILSRKIRFNINLAEVKTAGLKLDSNLIELATLVDEDSLEQQ